MQSKRHAEDDCNWVTINGHPVCLKDKDATAGGGKSSFNVSKSSNGKFETGKPVEFAYMHNTEKAPNLGSRFGQDIEPAGKYVLEKDHAGPIPDGWVEGKMKFDNPLVIEHEDTVTWKKKLSDASGGLTGKQLSAYIRKQGYDAIVTIDNGHTSEIVSLKPTAMHLLEQHAQQDCTWITINGNHVCIPENGKDQETKTAAGKSRNRPYKGDVSRAVTRIYLDYSSLSARNSEVFAKMATEHSDFKIPDDELAKTPDTIQIGYGESKKVQWPEDEDLMKSLYVNEAIYGNNDKPYLTLADRKEQERKFEVLVQNNPDHALVKEYLKNEVEAKALSAKLKDVFETTGSFYRGTSVKELDGYMDEGHIGGKNSGYKYVAMTVDPGATRQFSTGVVIDFDAESVREHASAKPVEYVARPIPLGTSKSVGNPNEGIGKPMNVKFANEMEVRAKSLTSVTPGAINGIKIRQIIIPENEVPRLKYSIDKYEKRLGIQFKIVKEEDWEQGAIGSMI